MSMAAWPSIDPASARSACCPASRSSLSRRNSRNPDGDHHDHHRPAGEFSQRELPAHQQRKDDAQFDDQVGRGDFEGHRGGEARALAEQRASQRHRGVGAGRRRDAERGGPGQRPRPVIAEQPDDRGPADDGLNDRGQREPEDQRPGDLPRHRPGNRQRLPHRVHLAHLLRPVASPLTKYPSGVFPEEVRRPDGARAGAGRGERAGPGIGRSGNGRSGERPIRGTGPVRRSGRRRPRSGCR